MVNFIKLTSLIINTAKISRIEIIDNKYSIYLINNNIEGFFIFTSGYIDTIHNKIDVCKVQHSKDYDTVTEWIERLK